jgi:hypothetical protein
VFPTNTEFVAHTCKPPVPNDGDDTTKDRFGAVFVPKSKHKRPTLTNHFSVEDVATWHQGFHTPYVDEGSLEPLNRSLLKRAYYASDGVPIDITQTPPSAFTCKLCSLLFASAQQINKHITFSQRHKRAVDRQRRDYMQQIWQDSTGEESIPVISRDLNHDSKQDSYRDRSEERRASISAVGQQSAYDNDTIEYSGKDAPISSNNIGHKLLLSMGWERGRGLGKKGDGIKSPILPDVLPKHSGLGTKR